MNVYEKDITCHINNLSCIFDKYASSLTDQEKESLNAAIQIMDSLERNKDTLIIKSSVKETINNDAYSHSCNCPECNKKIFRGSEERTFFCDDCGTELHQRAFTKEEIDEALFEHEMDEYED